MKNFFDCAITARKIETNKPGESLEFEMKKLVATLSKELKHLLMLKCSLWVLSLRKTASVTDISQGVLRNF